MNLVAKENEQWKMQETEYVKAARESGNIDSIVTAGAKFFFPWATGGMIGLLCEACHSFWSAIHRGTDADWRTIAAAEREIGSDILTFMVAIGLAD
jgi:hypothetical protein